MTDRRGASLATRIYLGTASVILLVLGAAVAVTTTLGERSAVRDARDRIAASAALEVDSQQQRYRQLGLLAEIMASKPEFKAYLSAAIGARDRASILDQLDERRSELGYDLAIVVDANGILAARTDLPQTSGVDLSSRPLVHQVREEFEAAGVWSERGRLFEAVAVPMAANDGLFGFLVLGYQIGDVRALEVKRSTGSDTVFVADAAATPVASSLPPQETERVLAALRAQDDLVARVAANGEAVVQQELMLGGERWLAQLSPLRDAGKVPVGAVVSLVSLDRALEGYVEIRNTLLLLGGGALLFALALSHLLARRVSKPIGELVRATSAAREGRYDVTIPAGGPGEVLALAASFDALLGELRERREMAENVEKLARNLPDEGSARRADVALDEPAASRDLALLGVELRQSQRPADNEEPQTWIERLSGDLRTVASVVGAHGGTLEQVNGARVIASFSGATRVEAAVAVASDLARLSGEAASDFETPSPPAAALAVGPTVSGGVRWGKEGARTLAGLPVQQLEALLREADEGDLMLSPAARAELSPAIARAELEVAAQRGLLSSQPLFLLRPEQSAAVAATSGQVLTHVSPADEPAGGARPAAAGEHPEPLGRAVD